MNTQIAKTLYLKYRLIIVPIVVALSGLVLIVLVIYPQLHNLISQSSLYDKTQEKSKVLEVKAMELNTIDETDLKKKLNLALVALPEEKDYLEIVNVLQTLTAKSGFSITSLQFGQTGELEKSSIGKAYGVKLMITGPKVAFDTFLNSIEKSYRAMRVGNLEITSSKIGSGAIEASLTINIFYAPLPTNIGSVESPLPRLSDKDETLINNLAKVISIAFAQNSVSAQSSSSLPILTGSLPPRGKSDPFE